MPELPEVEVARRALARWTEGHTILRAKTGKSRLLGSQSPQKVTRALTGRRVEAVERRGKHLLVRLSAGGGLYLHLGMTGRLLRDQPGKHVRLALELEDGHRIHFDDARMFGRIQVGRYETLVSRYFDPLGPDPLRDRLTPGALRAILGRSRRAIKVLLMEQRLIAGIGNIQATEALWLAKIDPSAPARSLDTRAISRLARAILESIDRTIRDLESGAKYLSEGGENRFFAYGRAGEPCPRCKTGRIARIVQAGRPTFFCPRCQETRG